MRRVNLFGLGDGSEGLQEIRALRSQPPGMASEGRRGKTFAAGLEQFEQLIEAGASLPPTSAPFCCFMPWLRVGDPSSQPTGATVGGSRPRSQDRG